MTFPQGRVVDVDPIVSRDGRLLVFRRDTTPFSGVIHRIRLCEGLRPEGESEAITGIVSAGKPTFTVDAREIVYASRGSLWRTEVSPPGKPSRLPSVGQDDTSPVIARTSTGEQRLAYVRSFADANIWRVDTGGPASSSPQKVIASTRSELIPSVSPDGRRLAFLADRSGDLHIWTASIDGSDAAPLSVMPFASAPGFPRWSPDGRVVAFHGDPKGRPDIFVMTVGTNRATILTSRLSDGAYPSFSRTVAGSTLLSSRRPRARLEGSPVGWRRNPRDAKLGQAGHRIARRTSAVLRGLYRAHWRDLAARSRGRRCAREGARRRRDGELRRGRAGHLLHGPCRARARQYRPGSGLVDRRAFVSTTSPLDSRRRSSTHLAPLVTG